MLKDKELQLPAPPPEKQPTQAAHDALENHDERRLHKRRQTDID